MTKPKRKMPEYITQIGAMGACTPAVRWLKKHCFRTLQQAWDACENASWMHWLDDKTQQRCYLKFQNTIGVELNKLVTKEAKRVRRSYFTLSDSKYEALYAKVYRKYMPKPPKLPNK